MSYDARSAGWVTPIKDQGGCGSCVAFGTTATVESAVRIANNNKNLSVDLSEAQVFYCYGKAAGATCGSGWWPDGALNGFKTGVVDATCFPYTAGDQNCNLCSNWKDRLTAIAGWTLVNSVTAMKTQISSEGPMTACFTVWLRATAEDHMQRVIAQGDMRPMAENRESMADLRKILSVREPLYSEADVAVDTSGRSLGESFDALLKAVQVTTSER